MSRIAQLFADLKQAQRTALVPYVVVGQPSVEATTGIVSALIEGGANMVELGVPFSDPIADGPVIQRATHESLLRGTTPRDCLTVAARIRRLHAQTPLIFMGYYNPILRFGLESYAKACAEAGVDGLIVPDLSLEESGELLAACRAHRIDLIPMIAPTSDDARIAALTAQASGFIYCVAVVGITGARTSISADIGGLVSRIRARSDLPVCIGFGISQAEHVRQVAQWADGAAVGSALVDLIAHAPSGQEARHAGDFIRALR
jgi:tryptophan synthase alpha chain